MIYIAGPTAVSSAAFTERGLSNKGPAELDSISIRASGPFNPSYRFMIDAIHGIAQAQISSTIVSVMGPVQVLNLVHPETFETPVMSANFPNATDEQIAELQTYGLVRDTLTKTFKGSPSSRNMSKIFGLGPVQGRFNPGTVSPDGYLAYMSLLRGLSIFTSVTTKSEHGCGINLVVKSRQITEGRDAMNFTIMSTGGLEYTVDKEDDNSCMDLEASISRVVVAPMSDMGPAGLNFVSTGISSVKIQSQEEGFCFPYFQGMVLPDKNIAWHIFEQLFSNCIAENPDTARIILSKIRAGSRQLALFPAGQALAHAYLGIKLALQSCASMSLIVESGNYQGFVLQTEGIKVSFEGSVYEALDVDGLVKEIADLSAHDKKLVEIVAVINSITQIVGTGRTAKVVPKYAITVDDVKTSRKLASIIYGLTDQEFEERKEKILDITDDLQYGDKFPQVSSDNLRVFLQFVATGDMTLIINYPAYIGFRFLAGRSRVPIGLGIYGPKAPSLNYGPRDGVVFNMPKDHLAQDHNVIVQADGTRLLKYLPFAMVSTKTACQQWDSLFLSGEFRFPKPRKNRKEFIDSRSISFQINGDPVYSEIYRLIKEQSSRDRLATSSKGKKRAAGDEDISEGKSAKKSKKDAGSLVGFV